MSLESHLKEFPSGLSMSTSNDTGIRSEKDFDDIVTQLGHEVYVPKSDNGIDRVVLTANGHIGRLYKLPLGLVRTISVMMVRLLRLIRCS